MKIDDTTGTVTHRTVLKKHRSPDDTGSSTSGSSGRRRSTAASTRGARRSSGRRSRPRNIGVVYLYGLIWIVFSLWVPDTWLTWLTHRSVLNQNAILFVVALGLLVPLAAGVFDLSIAGTISASAVDRIVGTGRGLVVDPRGDRLALLVGVVVGNINGFLVVQDPHRLVHRHARHELDTHRLCRVAVEQPLDPRIPRLVQVDRHGVRLGTQQDRRDRPRARRALWFVFEHTAAGRYLFATGGAREAARLAGVQTDRYVWGAMVASAVVASLGGVLLAAQFGSTQAQSGAPYLLPAFAAAFLGATQFKRRFNVWGTVLAVFVLQSGVKGLQLAGVGRPGSSRCSSASP